VVSLPDGAQSAARVFKKQLEYLESWDEVILMFDQDKPGQDAVDACAGLLSPGKVKVATLPLKDANACLTEGKGSEVIKAIWNAQTYRPDGILMGSDITLEELMVASSHGYSTPYPMLDEMYGGIRKGELTLLTAGSGIGKSTMAREIGYHFHQVHKLNIGNVYLEESHIKTSQGYVAIDNDVPLGDLRRDPSLLSKEAWNKSYQEVIQSGRMCFYKHFGSMESDNLLAKLKYMATGLETDFIILDHISIVVSGQESSSEGERKDIDRLMTRLRSLVEETGVGIIAIVHLKQPEGKPHEEGGRVTLSQLRGSGSLKQLSDGVIALERDQQDEEAKDLSTVRILKNREHGEVGQADTLRYHRSTGRLLPSASEDSPFDAADESEGSADF